MNMRCYIVFAYGTLNICEIYSVLYDSISIYVIYSCLVYISESENSDQNECLADRLYIVVSFF